MESEVGYVRYTETREAPRCSVEDSRYNYLCAQV